VPIAKLLPKPLNSYDVYRDSASALVTDPRWPTITPRMLLAHTSGLFNFATMEPDRKMHLHFRPGAKYLHSAEGMNLLTNSDNGERAFRPILETIMGNTVTPWEWEGYVSR
jgi:CubicO group peptidase (beta-lactamase class C family)